MKKLNLLLAIILVMVFSAFAMASGETEDKGDQGKDSANVSSSDNAELGDYSVVIDSSRLAKSYDGKDVIIVKYIFTNNSDEEGAAFYVAFDDTAYQNGVGLNKAYVLDDSANYNADNQTKEIKKGASIDVEVAYELNDNTTDVEVEVEELFSFNEKKLTKTFSITQ